MSIRWLQNVLTDTDYYIKNCYDEKALLKISADIEKARQELKDLEMMIFEQVGKCSQVVEYKEIIVNRRKSYKGGIEITVYVNKYKLLNGERLKKDESIYGTHKRFNGSEKKQAVAYANELKNQYHVNIIYENWR